MMSYHVQLNTVQSTEKAQSPSRLIIVLKYLAQIVKVYTYPDSKSPSIFLFYLQLLPHL